MARFETSELELFKKELRKEFPDDARLHQSLENDEPIAIYLVSNALHPRNLMTLTVKKRKHYEILYKRYMQIYSKPLVAACRHIIATTATVV